MRCAAPTFVRVGGVAPPQARGSARLSLHLSRGRVFALFDHGAVFAHAAHHHRGVIPEGLAQERLHQRAMIALALTAVAWLRRRGDDAAIQTTTGSVQLLDPNSGAFTSPDGVLPGQIGSTVLDTLHAGSEHAVHYFVR